MIVIVLDVVVVRAGVSYPAPISLGRFVSEAAAGAAARLLVSPALLLAGARPPTALLQPLDWLPFDRHSSAVARLRAHTGGERTTAQLNQNNTRTLALAARHQAKGALDTSHQSHRHSDKHTHTLDMIRFDLDRSQSN